MNPIPRHSALALVLAMMLSACAGQTVRTPPPEAVVVESGVAGAEPVAASPATGIAPAADETAVAVVETGTAEGTAAPAIEADSQAVTDAAGDTPPTTAAEDDFNALYGNPEYDPVADSTLPPGVSIAPSYDPWEPFNRRMHALNNLFDRTLWTPAARAYMKVVPRPLRLGVSNFFNNLGQPGSAVNALLQGRPKDSAIALLRFSVNFTIGVGGLFDPASRMKIPYRDEDFGQTLAVWGWRQSRYLELPLFGPRTVRDVFGMAGDAPLSPLGHVNDARTVTGIRGLQLLDIRSRLFSIDAMREGAADEYALYRDAWLQRRNYQIMSGLRDAADKQDNLPDYLQEEPDNPRIPMDAIPINP